MDESDGSFSVIRSDLIVSVVFSGGRDPPASMVFVARGFDGEELLLSWVAGRSVSCSFVLGRLFVGISDGSSIFWSWGEL